MGKKYIDAEHFDKRVREAMGIAMDDFPMGYPDPVQAVLAMLKTEPSVYVPRWIPVTERLPEKSGEYLVVLDSLIYFSWFYKDDGVWSFKNADITAWMQLPEPYKGGEEE